MSRHPFDLLMELESDQIRLDCAALHLARDRYAGLDIGNYLQMLDAMAQDVAELRPGLSAPQRYGALRRVLAEERRLSGNRVDYYDPANCYLNNVLDTGLGIPITLSIVWIEVGRRLKWPVSGVALPGHFVVRIDDPERYVLADPFYDGVSLNIADCRQRVAERFGDDFPFSRSYLRPISGRGVLARLLRNLRNVYLVHNDLPGVASILQRMRAAEPDNGRHLQDLAAVCCRQGDVRAAATHLAEYLDRRPNARDSASVRYNLRRLRAALIALN